MYIYTYIIYVQKYTGKISQSMQLLLWSLGANLEDLGRDGSSPRPSVIINEKENIKTVRNIKKLKHYTKYFQVKVELNNRTL